MQSVITMKWFAYAKKTYSELQEITKNLLVFCVGYITAIALSSAVCYLIAGRWASYYTAMTISADLLLALRPCAVLSVLGVLLLEGYLIRTQ